MASICDTCAKRSEPKGLKPVCLGELNVSTEATACFRYEPSTPGEAAPAPTDIALAYVDQLAAQLKFVRDGAHTIRYHTVPRIEQERVGQHSFGVGWLLWLLTNGTVSAALLMHAKAHDVPEWQYGDIPSPTKAALGIREVVAAHEASLLQGVGIVLPPLSVAEEQLLRLADVMDGMLSCVRERAMGNKLILGCYTKFAEVAKGLLHSERAKDLYFLIDEQWQEACK